jgi:hypothetical protein
MAAHMKSLLIAVLLVSGSYLAYQKYNSNDLYGEWVLDVDAMSKQLAAHGVSQPSIEAFARKNGNGLTKTVISKDTMAVTLMGESIDLPYAVASKAGQCTKAKVGNSPRILEYCVKGNVLEIRNPHNSVVEVFKRS